MLERVARLAIGLLVLAVGASLLASSAASNTVPISSSDRHTDTPVADDLKPAECAGIAIAGLVTGSGTFSGTAANDLILGSAAADTITSNGGDDCVLSGAGADDLFAGIGDGTGGTSDVLDAGADADYCRGEGGTVTYVGCENVAISLVGGWQLGLTHAAPAGQDRALIFVATVKADDPTTLTSVTYGGQPLVQVATRSSGGGRPVTAEIWVLDEAGITAAADATFVPTWSMAVIASDYSSLFLNDVNQASLTGAVGANDGNNDDPLTTGAVATAWGDMVIFGVASDKNVSFAPNNGFVEGTDDNPGGLSMESAHKLASGVNETPSTTPSSGSGRWAMVAAVIKSVTTP